MTALTDAIYQNTPGNSQGFPLGVPTNYGWYYGKAGQLDSVPPSDFSAVTGWGLIYPEANQPVVAGTVQIANFETYLHLTNGNWVLAQDQAQVGLGGAHYVADFAGDSHYPWNAQTLSDGSVSVDAPVAGYNDHFWPAIRGTYTPGTVDGVFVEASMKTDDPNANLVANVGADWWLNSTAPFDDGFANNSVVGVSDWVKLTTNWQPLYFTSLSPQQLAADPPPGLPASPASNLFGSTIHDVLRAGGEVYALYDAILGRTPDLLGFEGWASILKHGTASLHDVAASLLASPEGQSRVGSPNNAAFVEQLYETALHRPGDSNGLQGWTNALNQGASRADVAIDFALSAENVAGMQTSLNAGVFVPDQNAANVARLYYGGLGRAPDSSGLSGWTGLVDGGSFSFKNLTQAFLNSPEYQNAHTGQSDAQFIDDLYVNALGRHAESAGLQGWINALSHGASHADVALGISESQEAQQHHLPQIEQGWLLA